MELSIGTVNIGKR